jgi:hypothetical protein
LSGGEVILVRADAEASQGRYWEQKLKSLRLAPIVNRKMKPNSRFLWPNHRRIGFSFRLFHLVNTQGLRQAGCMFRDERQDFDEVPPQTQFPTTHWIPVLTAGTRDLSDAKQRWKRLAKRTGIPLYASFAGRAWPQVPRVSSSRS